MISWAGNAQNLAITGAAWIVMDYLRQMLEEKFQKAPHPHRDWRL